MSNVMLISSCYKDSLVTGVLRYRWKQRCCSPSRAETMNLIILKSCGSTWQSECVDMFSLRKFVAIITTGCKLLCSAIATTQGPFVGVD